MKRRLITLLTAVLLCNCLTMPLYANESTGSAETNSFEAPNSWVSVGLYNTLKNGMALCQEKIDVSAYRVNEDQLKDAMNDVEDSEAELFHVQTRYNYSYETDTGYITEVRPTYNATYATYQSRLSEVRAEANRIISGMQSSWSSLEKALYLHDYIAAWYDYDIELYNHDVYSLIKSGEGVCEAYTLWYNYLLNKVGVETDYSISDSMNHIWSLVKLGNSWYHVDVTHDDPTNTDNTAGAYGLAYHNNFLLSDAAISETHYGFVDDKTCDVKIYDKATWRNTNAPITWLDGSWYAVMDNSIGSYSTSTGVFTPLHTFTEKWPVWGNPDRIYTSSFTGLSALEGGLIYVTPDDICFYDPKANCAVPMYTLTSTSEGYIYGGTVKSDGRFYFDVSTAPDKGGKFYYKDIEFDLLPNNTVWVETGRINPTCLKEGYVTYASSTNASYTKTEMIPMTGHSFDGRLNLVAPISNQPGAINSYYQNCTVCGAKGGVVAMVPTAYQNAFTDIEDGKWYSSAVAYAVTNGLFSGVSADRFAPSSAMNRAMLVTVLWRMEGSPMPTGANPFTDLRADAYYVSPVLWAQENGIVTGKSTDRFAPDDQVTREQLATILYRYAQKKGYNVSARAGVTGFPDSNTVSNYAIDTVSWARAAGLIEGVNSYGITYLKPKGSATRAQVATILMRFCTVVAR